MRVRPWAAASPRDVPSLSSNPAQLVTLTKLDAQQALPALAPVPCRLFQVQGQSGRQPRSAPISCCPPPAWPLLPPVQAAFPPLTEPRQKRRRPPSRTSTAPAPTRWATSGCPASSIPSRALLVGVVKNPDWMATALAIGGKGNRRQVDSPGAIQIADALIGKLVGSAARGRRITIS